MVGDDARCGWVVIDQSPIMLQVAMGMSPLRCRNRVPRRRTVMVVENMIIFRIENRVN